MSSHPTTTLHRPSTSPPGISPQRKAFEVARQGTNRVVGAELAGDGVADTAATHTLLAPIIAAIIAIAITATYHHR
jgi:hypothetical protein